MLLGTVTPSAKNRRIVETISVRVIKQINGLDAVRRIIGKILAIIFVVGIIFVLGVIIVIKISIIVRIVNEIQRMVLVIINGMCNMAVDVM